MDRLQRVNSSYSDEDAEIVRRDGVFMDDSQAKGTRTLTVIPPLIMKLPGLLSIKNASPAVRQVQLAATLLFLFFSSLLFYSCALPGFCSAAEMRRKDGDSAMDYVKPFFVAHKKPLNYVNPIDKDLPEVLRKALLDPWQQKVIPVVQMYQRPGSLPCQKSHYIYRSLQQARKVNDVVYFIGPDECGDMAKELDIVFEPYSQYQDVVAWFSDNIGTPIGFQVRWFVLRVFMERHALARVFFCDADVALYANITGLAEMLYPKSHVVLPLRWPSLRPPLGPSQYVSTSVSGHVSLWSYEALLEFNLFSVAFFKNAVLDGTRGDKSLVEQPAYSDMALLGWYSYNICWRKNPIDMHPKCVADKESGVTPSRSARLRGKVSPQYKVESLCEPRWCNATDWVDEGWCAFDNFFSVQTPRQYFRYRPNDGMKCPTTMHYTYFQDWSNQGEPQTSPVQILGVHFQAHKKGYISRAEDPATTWGSSED